jgi:hypothetical protein
MLDGRHSLCERASARGHARARHQHARLRVLDDVGERIVAHADVERHRHRSEAHGPEERLEKPPVVVERQRHPVLGSHAQAGQRVGDAVAARIEVGEGEDGLVLEHGRRRRREDERAVEQVAEIVGQHRVR